MHWTALFLAAYAFGFVEFWRLCKVAPITLNSSDNTAA